MKKLYFFCLGAIAFLPFCLLGQNRAFLNGGFESPLMDTSSASNISEYFISHNAPSSVNGARITEWNTTAPDYNVELRRYSASVNKGEPSAVGNQHAEINATTVGRLYQDICLVNGETMTYSFYHRGRKGYDLMEVNLYDASGTTKITTLKTAGDDNTAWKFYNDTYYVNVPSGTYQFSFESISSAGSSNEGNLLDEINIQLYPLVSFSKPTYSAQENTVKAPALKVNGTVPTGGLTITLGVTSMSAAEGTDYTVVDTVTVPEGKYNLDSDSFPVSFHVLDDAVKEYDEEVHFRILSVTNGAVISDGCGGSTVATYTILDDDVFDAGPDQTVCPGDTLVFSATGGLDPKWKKGIKQGVPFKAPSLPGTYVYTAYDTVQVNYANNLLQNFDFSAGNTGFATQYGYDPRTDPTFNSGYLQSGFYNVTGNPKGANKALDDMEDHSGTAQSNMLVVNSAGFPNLSFWSQTVSVQPNTDYLFSFWATAVSFTSAPMLRFNINGVAGNVNTLPLTWGWIQFTQKWNSGTNTSATIRGVNLNTVAASNDFVLDDLYFGAVSSFTDSLKVMVKSAPSPVTKNIDTCQQVGTDTLTAVGSNLTWYNDTLPGSIGSSTAPVLDLHVPDTLSKWVSQRINGCESKRTEIKVAIRALPSTPISHPLDTCQTTGSYSLKAQGTNVKWYNSALGGTALSSVPIVSLSVPDTVSYWVSQTLNGCEGPRDSMFARVNPTPTTPLVRDTLFCQQTGTYTPTAVGSHLTWYHDTLSGSIGTTTAPVIDLNVPDTLTQWVSQVTNGCESKKSALRISVKKLPSAPVLYDLDTCQTTGSYALKATGTNLKWYQAATGGTANTITPTVTLGTPDTLMYWASQTLNGCEGPRDSAFLQIKTTPPAPQVRDTVLCQQTGTITFHALGSQLKWYDAATAGNAVSSLSFPTSIVDTTSLWVSQSLHNCEGPRRKMTLNIKPTPGPPTVRDTSLCQKTGTLLFKASGTNLLWYASGSTTGSTITPSVNTDLVQTTRYFVSQTISGCEGPKTLDSIEIRPIPAVPSITNQTFCQSSGTVNYLASGSNLKWHANTTTLSFSTTTPSENKNNVGIHHMYVSQTQYNCESPRADVTITIQAIPIAPSIADAQYCLHALASPLTTLSDSLFWYTVSSGGAPSSVIPVPNTQVIGTTYYWASAVKKGCEGPRTALKATVYALPNVHITGPSSGSYCAKSTLSFGGTGATQYDWRLPSGSHLIQASWSLPSFSVSDTGKYILTGIDLNHCSAKDSILLTLRNPPAITATPISICEKAPIHIQASTTGTAYWKLPGNRVQHSSLLSIPVSSYADNGQYKVISTQNGCTDSIDIEITVSNCKPTALDDQYTIFCDETLKVDARNHPILNDSDPNDSLAFEDFTILTTPRYGKVTLEPNGFWTYSANSETEATEVLEYQICDKGIPVLCATAKIEINLKKRDAFFPDAFTPNGDGINDSYTVYNLAPHIKVELTVFNRWGDLVYQNSDYKNEWKGTCAASMCLGSELPVGTYYLVAQLSNGYKHTTYVTLNR